MQIERIGFFLFLAAVSAALVYIVWPFAAPLLWATLAAVMFQPLYLRVLGKLQGRENLAAVLTLLVITVAVIIPALIVGSLVVEEATLVVLAFSEGRIDIGSWFDTVIGALPAGVRAMLDDSGWGDLAGFTRRAQQLAQQSLGLIAERALAIGSGVAGWVLSFGVGLYVTYFLLRDGRKIAPQVIHALPMDDAVAMRMSQRFISVVRATIKGSGVVALVQGALGAITFWIAGLPSVVLFGVLMAFFSLLPAVGPALVWVPAAIYLFATGAIWQGVVVVVSGVAVIGIADNILRPILVGRDTGIPDWIILVTTLGGIATLGLSGIVVGPLIAGLFLSAWAVLGEVRGQTTHNGEQAPPAAPSS